jgi:hypothetical protein
MMAKREWCKSQEHPNYESGEMGEIRKVGTSYAERLPQFWGRLDGQSDPEWLVTIIDESTRKTLTVPVADITGHKDFPETYYEN